MQPHLILVLKMVYSHVLLQVVRIVLQPGQIAPVEVPLFTSDGQTGRDVLSRRDSGNVAPGGAFRLTLWLLPNPAFVATRPARC